MLLRAASAASCYCVQPQPLHATACCFSYLSYFMAHYGSSMDVGAATDKSGCSCRGHLVEPKLRRAFHMPLTAAPAAQAIIMYLKLW